MVCKIYISDNKSPFHCSLSFHSYNKPKSQNLFKYSVYTTMQLHLSFNAEPSVIHQ